MNDEMTSLTIALANYIIENACTVRAAAAAYGLGKSTVHKYVTERLFAIDKTLYEKVRTVLDYNLSVRHLRGGEATRKKCRAKKGDL